MRIIYETRAAAPSLSLAKTQSGCSPLSQRGSVTYKHVCSTLVVLLSERRVPTLPATLLSGAERHVKMGHTSIHRTHMETAMSRQLSEVAISCKMTVCGVSGSAPSGYKGVPPNQQQKHAKMAYIPKVLHRLCSHYSPFEVIFS